MINRTISILILLLCLFAGQSCSDDDNSPTLSISTETLDFPSEASSLDLEISSSNEWTVTIDKPWCKIPTLKKVNPACTGKVLSITVERNNSLQERTATITFTETGGMSRTVTVTQSATDELDPYFKTFKFASATNTGKLAGDVICKVEGTTVSARTSFVIEDKVLIPEFEFDGWKVYMGDQEVVSGQTAIDFSGAVTLFIKNQNGEQKEYTVRLTSFTGLPVIYIDTGGVPIDSKENYVSATIRVIDNNGLRPSSILQSAVDIKGRGNSTWGMPKKPYRLKFDKKTSLLGEPKDKSWVLLANYMDNACGMRNATAYSIGHLSNLDFTPTVHYVEVFLNGNYNGTYQLCEHMKISEDRVDVTDDGFLLEADQLERLDPGDVYFQTSRILLNIKDPDVVIGSTEYNWIKDYVNEAEDALYGANFKDPDVGYKKYLDIDSYVDWYVISEITKTNDAALYTSCYMNIAPNGKLKMGPIWDFDICIGNTKWNGTDGRGPEGYWNRNSPWFERMLQDPAFVQKVKERISHFRSNLPSILSQMDANAGYISLAVVEDNFLWQNIKPSGTQDEVVRAAFNQDVRDMQTWLTARLNWLDQASFQD